MRLKIRVEFLIFQKRIDANNVEVREVRSCIKSSFVLLGDIATVGWLVNQPVVDRD